MNIPEPGDVLIRQTRLHNVVLWRLIPLLLYQINGARHLQRVPRVVYQILQEQLLIDFLAHSFLLDALAALQSELLPEDGLVLFVF